jgi:MotA/TolQ/ExbB proton channel family
MLFGGVVRGRSAKAETTYPQLAKNPSIIIVADSALAAVIASGTVTVAFITTAAGLLVAIPATWSYNYLRTRIDLLEIEISSDVPVRTSRHFRFIQKFPLAALFSRLH